MTAAPLGLVLPGGTSANTTAHVVSYGLGVESSAYLVEVLTSPERHGIDLSSMLVLHAVVGSEWSQTYADAERFLLPLLADRGVRTVQIARGGPRDADGVVVLDDTTRPRRIQRRGPWTLADESTVSGTVPQLSHRRCSLKFKGWPLDQWIGANLKDAPFDHVIGYSAEETRRAERDLVYATATRRPLHPLISWGWTRDACLARLFAEFDTIFSKSACVFCPFAGGRSLESTLRRMREHPDEAATALLLEAPAVALNPNSKLFGSHSLLDRLTEDRNLAALLLFRARLEAEPWSVYDVRRIYFAARNDPTRKGTSWRAVRPTFTGTAEQARAHLSQAGPVDEGGRVWLRRQHTAGPYPRAEHFLVATTAGIRPKSRAAFERHWQLVTGLTLALPVMP